MSTTTLPGPRRVSGDATRPLWVSVEGINGVGKTAAVRATAASLGPRCLLLDELTDQTADTLPGQVIAALAASGDVFLRTGHPVVETLALLALKVRETERLRSARPAGIDVILEDRGIDTVAVYQGAILHTYHRQTPARAVAEQILTAGRRWRPLPDATILLTGDRAVCATRFATRIGRDLTKEDLDVIEQADQLYQDLAADDPGRFTVIDVTGHNPDETAQAVESAVRAAATQREAHHAP
ncbi:dTMP kinase [Streptomyces sp. NPDC055103]